MANKVVAIDRKQNGGTGMRRVTALALIDSPFSLLIALLASARTDDPNQAIGAIVPPDHRWITPSCC
jgi:hypothetical protein